MNSLLFSMWTIALLQGWVVGVYTRQHLHLRHVMIFAVNL